MKSHVSSRPTRSGSNDTIPSLCTVRRVYEWIFTSAAVHILVRVLLNHGPKKTDGDSSTEALDAAPQTGAARAMVETFAQPAKLLLTRARAWDGHEVVDRALSAVRRCGTVVGEDRQRKAITETKLVKATRAADEGVVSNRSTNTRKGEAATTTHGLTGHAYRSPINGKR